MAKSDEILKQIGGLSTQVGITNTKLKAVDDKVVVCNEGIKSLVKNNREQWKAINRVEKKSIKVDAKHNEEDKQIKSTEVKLERKFIIYAALIGVTGAIIVGVILRVA